MFKNNELQHHGVKGMKWGQRKDGLLRQPQHSNLRFRTSEYDYDDSPGKTGKYTSYGRAVQKAKDEGRYIDNDYDARRNLNLTSDQRSALARGEKVTITGYKFNDATTQHYADIGKRYVDDMFTTLDFEDWDFD